MQKMSKNVTGNAKIDLCQVIVIYQQTCEIGKAGVVSQWHRHSATCDEASQSSDTLLNSSKHCGSWHSA